MSRQRCSALPCPRAARSASVRRPVRTTTAATSSGPVEWWESKGYRVKLSDGVWDQDDYVAGTPEQRAADLNALFADPEVDVIQVAVGRDGRDPCCRSSTTT